MSIMGVLAYFPFSWVGGLIVYFMSKDDRVARFHGMQSVLFYFIYAIVISIIIGVMFGVALAVAMVDQNIGGIAMLLASGLSGIIGLVMAVLVLWTMWQAFNDKMYKLPLIGGLAEKWSA